MGYSVLWRELNSPPPIDKKERTFDVKILFLPSFLIIISSNFSLPNLHSSCELMQRNYCSFVEFFKIILISLFFFY